MTGTIAAKPRAVPVNQDECANYLKNSGYVSV